MSGPVDDKPQEEAPRLTAKQRVLQAKGQEVPLDLFLYSCLEQERLIRARRKSGALEIRWPALAPDPLPEDWDLQPEPYDESSRRMVESTGLSELLAAMAAWYAEEYPALADGATLDHEQLVKVLPAFVGFSRDLGRLHEQKNGAELPAYDKAAASNPFWDEVAATLKKFYPTYQHYFVRYVQWSHAVEVKEEFVPGSRPPIGKYAPPLPPRSSRFGGRDGGRDGGRGGPRGGGDRGGPRGGSDRGGPRGSSDRGPRPERGPREDGPREDGPREARPPRDDQAPRESPAPRDDQGPGGEAPAFESRPPRPDRAPRGDRPPREDRGPRGDRPPRGRESSRPPRENDEATVRMTESAVAEVERAIQELRSNTSIDEVTLRPANSFYRRVQHQHIVDNGFHSFSVGEGPDRAVKVSRKES